MAGLGLIGSALAGAAQGVGEAGKQLGEYTARASLQDEAAKIQTMRDKTLMAMREEYDIRGENRKRDQAVKIGSEAEAARTALIDDPSGTPRARNATEGADAEAAV